MSAKAKASSSAFDLGVAKYLASNCAEAMEPLYQATLVKDENTDRARLYLAHCQFVLGQNQNAVFHMDQIKSKKLAEADRKLYKDLKDKYQKDFELAHKLYWNVSPYYGSSNTSPKTVKADSQFYGLSAGVSRPEWSASLFAEQYSLKMAAKTSKDYSQTMVGTQVGYFVMPSWRLSLSYTSITASIDQLKSQYVVGLQTDYYITPFLSLFLEYYRSDYPTLVADSSGKYKFDVAADEAVIGVSFPLYTADTWSLSGSASYTSISVTKPKDSGAVVPKNIKDAGRGEASLTAFFNRFSLSGTYWSGSEILGVRGRGAVVYNSTDRHTNGAKGDVRVTVATGVGVGLSYGVETYEAYGVDGSMKDFTSSTVTGSASFNW